MTLGPLQLELHLGPLRHGTDHHRRGLGSEQEHFEGVVVEALGQGPGQARRTGLAQMVGESPVHRGAWITPFNTASTDA